MEKNKFKLGDVLQLESEINGFVNPETGQKVYDGFLKQNLSILLKYELVEFGETLKKEKNKVETLRNELVKKYGEETETGILVKMFIETKDEEGNVVSRTMNPQYIEFDTEYGELLNAEIELEYPEITKEDLKSAGKTNDAYHVLFRLIKKD
jgi:hypothetical protein